MRTQTTNPIELTDDLLRRQKQPKRGLDISWPTLNKHLSLKKGYPLFIGGLPGSGKTEILMDLMLNASIMHGWKWLILSPEMGDSLEIVEQLVSKCTRGTPIEQLKPNDYEKYIVWVSKHFRILDPQTGWKDMFAGINLNLENFFKALDHSGKVPYDGIVVDPFNELDFSSTKHLMNHVKDELDILNSWTKQNDILTILTNHVNDKKEFREKDELDNWFQWTPPAKKEEWAYGQQFARKGYQMLLMYEPHPTHIRQASNNGDTSAAHSMVHASERGFHNIRHAIIQKTKPKGVGMTGKVSLHYDIKLQRYYEWDDINMTKKGILWPEV